VKGTECVYFILRPVAIFFVTITLLEYNAGGLLVVSLGGASPVGI
jgi:hypothetical protein